MTKEIKIVFAYFIIFAYYLGGNQVLADCTGCGDDGHTSLSY